LTLSEKHWDWLRALHKLDFLHLYLISPAFRRVRGVTRSRDIKAPTYGQESLRKLNSLVRQEDTFPYYLLLSGQN